MFVTLDVREVLSSNDIALALDTAERILMEDNDILVEHTSPHYVLPVFNVVKKPRNIEELGIRWISINDREIYGKG